MSQSLTSEMKKEVCFNLFAVTVNSNRDEIDTQTTKKVF